MPDIPLTNIELFTYAQEPEIPHWAVFMRDTLTLHLFKIESDIVNFNTSSQPVSHWVRYYRNKTNRIYFDSYGDITPVEMQRYLTADSMVRKLYREI